MYHTQCPVLEAKQSAVPYSYLFSSGKVYVPSVDVRDSYCLQYHQQCSKLMCEANLKTEQLISPHIIFHGDDDSTLTLYAL